MKIKKKECFVFHCFMFIVLLYEYHFIYEFINFFNLTENISISKIRFFIYNIYNSLFFYILRLFISFFEIKESCFFDIHKINELPYSIENIEFSLVFESYLTG